MKSTLGIDILLVEDNPDQAEFALKALGNGDGVTRAHWVQDGEEALDFLHRRRRWADADAPRPGLILLDINLPKLSGHEVLRAVKGDDTLRAIPVVMLTTSDRAEEVASTYRAGANSFVTKSAKFQQFKDQMKELKEYWTRTNRLPASA